MQLEQYKAYATHVNANKEVIEWVETTLKNYLEKNAPTTEEVEHIIDFLVMSEHKNPTKTGYPEAKKLAQKWLEQQIKKGEDIIETEQDTEVVLDFGDGFKIVKLVGENAYKREGFLMSHCVADYFGRDVEIYSLRDSKNMPHCTIEKDQQIKGKGNGDIHPNYIDYVVKFLEHTGMTVGDSEMKHLGYVNIESVKDEIDTSKAFKEKYLPKNTTVTDKNGNKYESISLWNIFGLVKIDSSFNVKFNFDISTSIQTFLSRAKNSTAVANEHSSTAVANGSNSVVVISNSNNSKAKAKIGSVIVIVERGENGNIINVNSAIVDGKKLKEDTFYTLKDGKFVEVQ